MDKFKDKILNFLHNKTYMRRLTIVFLIFVFSLISFLTINLFKLYFKSIKNNDDIKLYYNFKPNTVAYAFRENKEDDISEQFLSYDVSYGIDVSEWQGKIDWERVRQTGISFAMIRCGFRETHGSNVKEDAMFKENIEGAIEAGIRVGVYFFGTAKNTTEALEEAEFTINLIKDYNLTYPVAYDSESFDEGRLRNVDYSTITDNILTFTETVGSYGYDTMVYSYYNAFTGKLDTGKLDGKLIWLAHYTDTTGYKGNYNMWQYSSEGRVDGIKTNVDLNISYFQYVENENDIVDNPNYVSAPNVEFQPVTEDVMTTKKVEFHSSPSLEIPNKLGTLNKNTELKRVGISENLSQVLYNGKIVFIENEFLRSIT